MNKFSSTPIYKNNVEAFGNLQQEIEFNSLEPKWNKSRALLIDLNSDDVARLEKAFKRYNRFRNIPGEDEEVVICTIAQILAEELDKYSAKIASALDRARNGEADMLYICGLPVSKELSILILLTFSYRLGYPMNYSIGGKRSLIDVKFSNTPRSEYKRKSRPPRYRKQRARDFYSLFATFPRECRPEWSLSLGVANTAQTTIGYIPFLDVFDSMSIENRKALSRKRLYFPVPLGYGFDKVSYISHGPTLRVSSKGAFEVMIPHTLSDFHELEKFSLADPMRELKSLASRKIRTFAMKPGALLIVNNYRGLHTNPQIMGKNYMVLRTYVRTSLHTLRYISESAGPVFDPKSILKTHIIRD